MKASQARRSLSLTPTRLRVRDLVMESVTGTTRNFGRSMLTAVGTILGASAFVATLGLTNTLSHQVSSTFDERRATEVVVRANDLVLDTNWFSSPAISRLSALNGVESAGARVLAGDYELKKSILPSEKAIKLAVQGIDSGALEVVAPHIVQGRLIDLVHETLGAHVVMLSSNSASTLQVTKTGVSVFIDEVPFVVIGIFDEVARRPEVLSSAIIPFSAGSSMSNGSVIEHDILIATVAGAGQLIAKQAPYALRPEGANSLTTTSAPDPQTLRREVESNVAQLSFLVSSVTLVIGGVSIANAATASVAARTAEIGLRRALGARPRHVAAQLLGETSMLGAIGGVVGVFLGVAVILITSIYEHWVPVLDGRVVLIAIGSAAGIGLLAGFAPALRAMKISPVEALQR